MENINANMKFKINFLIIIGLVCGLFLFTACGGVENDNIVDNPNTKPSPEVPDEPYIYNNYMMSDYLKEFPEYSYFKDIAEHASSSDNSLTNGSLIDMLSSYGHYTLFLPDNNAIKDYLNKELHMTLEELLSNDVLCDKIVRTHLVQEIYFTSDMSAGVLPTKNMMQRDLNVEISKDEQGHDIIIINNKAKILFSQEHQNEEVINGVIHRIDAVITNNVLSETIENDPNIKTYVKALQLTGLNSMLELVEDLEYRINYNGDYFETINSGIHANEKAYYPEHRYYGFTAFMVKDKTLEKYNSMLSNKFNSDGDVSQNILALSELASKYYTTSIPYTSTDYSNTEHPLYKFMAYHLLDRNVHNYNLLTVREDAGIDVSLVNPTDWYTTCLPYSMIKVEHLTVSGEAEGAWLGEGVKGDYYINRNYNKKSKVEGVHVQPSVDVQENNAINGIYFYVDDIMVFDDNTKDKVFNTRIRMDFSTLFPEIMTNNIRMNGPSITSSNIGKNYCFPQGYLTGVKFNTDDSHLIYCYPKSDSYAMNGDEMRGQGYYDITFNLPPVPFTGEWQIRLGYTADEKSGIVQIYLNEYPMGIPLDFRKTLENIIPNWNATSYTDLRQNESNRLEDYKILKNQGYCRGPHSVFNSSNGQINGKYNTFSEMSNAFRKILSTNNLKVGETYKIRLKKLTSQGNIMLDYLELVPKSVYGINEGDVEDDL